jgi:hypothetical protein
MNKEKQETVDIDRIAKTLTGKTLKELFEDRMERENQVKVCGYYGVRWEERKNE